MPVSWYGVQDLQQVLWAKAEGIKQQTRLDLLKRTWKTSIWSEEDVEEMTLPNAEVPLVYSLHYAQQGCQDREDELPRETLRCMTKQEKGKSNLHADQDFPEKLESMNPDPRLSKLIQKYQEFLERCPHPCLAKKWFRCTSNSNLSFKGLW